MARDPKTHPLYVWRKANGNMPLHEIAKQVGCTQPHLSEIENGNNNPSLGLAMKLSQFTGIDVKEFAKTEPAQ